MGYGPFMTMLTSLPEPFVETFTGSVLEEYPYSFMQRSSKVYAVPQVRNFTFAVILSYSMKCMTFHPPSLALLYRRVKSEKKGTSMKYMKS